MKRLKVKGTANFSRNLEALRDFHTEHPDAFVRAVARLQDEVLPLLRLQPHVGRLHGRGREVLLDEYVLLYLAGEKVLTLVSIRHQRELDFDFGD